MKKLFLSLLAVLLFSFPKASASSSWGLVAATGMGFVNSQVKPGLNLLANPFSGTLIVTSPRQIGVQPQDALGLQLYQWQPDSQTYYVSLYDDLTESFQPSLQLRSGEGFFVRNPHPRTFTITFTGALPSGTITYDFPKGTYLLGSKIPQTGVISRVLRMPPLPCQVFLFNGSRYDSFYYDDLENAGWTPFEPTITVGQGFWLRVGQHSSWSFEFNAN